MIAYEIQLWYVIRDKIQSETFFFFCQKKNLSEKKFVPWIEFCHGRCLGQIDAYHH